MVIIAIAPALYFPIGFALSQSDSAVPFPPPEPPFDASSPYVRREELNQMLEFVADAMESMAAWTQSVKDCLMFTSCYSADFYNANGDAQKLSSPAPPPFPEPPIPPFPSPSPSPPEPNSYESLLGLLSDTLWRWGLEPVHNAAQLFTKSERRAQRQVDRVAATEKVENAHRNKWTAPRSAYWTWRRIFETPSLPLIPSPSPYPHAGHWEEELVYPSPYPHAEPLEEVLVYHEEVSNLDEQLAYLLSKDVDPPKKEWAIANAPRKLAPYQCSPVGFRCADMFPIFARRNIVPTMFYTESAAQKACDEEPRCVSYDTSNFSGTSYLCRSNRVRRDKGNDYKVCQRGPYRSELVGYEQDDFTYDNAAYYYSPMKDVAIRRPDQAAHKNDESLKEPHEMEPVDDIYDYSYDNSYTKNVDEFVKFLFGVGAE